MISMKEEIWVMQIRFKLIDDFKGRLQPLGGK
jgi:hypothetical protein